MWSKISRLISENTEAKKIFENFSWLFFDKIAKFAVGFFVSVWVANYLKSEQFGAYNAALAYMFLFTALASLGLKSIVVRELVIQKEKRGEILGTSLLLTILGGAIAYVLSVGLAFLLTGNGDGFVFLVAIINISLLFHFFQIFSYFFTAIVESKYVAIATSTGFFISSALKAFGVWSEKNVYFFAGIIALDALMIGIMLLLFYLKKEHKKVKWRAGFAVGKALLKESFPLILSGIMIAVYMKIDQVMLREMIGNHEVGVYSVSVKLTEVWYFIPVILQSSVFPNFTKQKISDEGKYNDKLYRLFSLVNVFSYCVIIGALVFGDAIISLLYNQEYQPAISMLYVSIFALLFVGLGVVRNAYLVLNRMTIYSFYFTVMGAIINVVMNYFLIPLYGGLGAAISTVVAYGLSAFLSTFLIEELRPIGALMIKSLVQPKFW